MKIDENQKFIVLDYDAETNVHKLAFVDSADEALNKWGANTRISPVWRLVPGLAPLPHRLRKKIGIAFLGPVNPLFLETDFGATIFKRFKVGQFWSSLGFFNLIILLADDDEFETAKVFAEQRNCSIELWEFDDEGLVSLIEATKKIRLCSSGDGLKSSWETRGIYCKEVHDLESDIPRFLFELCQFAAKSLGDPNE